MPVKYLPRTILAAIIGVPMWFYVLEHLSPSVIAQKWIFFTVFLLSLTLGLTAATLIERAIIRLVTRK